MDELYQDESDHWLFNAQHSFFFFLLNLFLIGLMKTIWHWLLALIDSTTIKKCSLNGLRPFEAFIGFTSLGYLPHL
jgi:hypothetical protein